MKERIIEQLVALLILLVFAVGVGLTLKTVGFAPKGWLQIAALAVILVAVVKFANWIAKKLVRKNQESKEIKKCQE